MKNRLLGILNARLAFVLVPDGIFLEDFCRKQSRANLILERENIDDKKFLKLSQYKNKITRP